LATGSAPGSPMHTGQTWVLGSAPKAVGQPQNILVAVCSSTCTSIPMTGSKRDTTSVNSMRNNLAEEAGGLAVAVLWNGLAHGNRVLYRRHLERLAPQGDDLAEISTVHRARRVPPEPGREHAIVGRGRTTTLDVPEHGRADVAI